MLNNLKKKTNGYYLTVISKLQFTKKDIGTSISCSGVCLTLTKIKKYKSKNELFFYLSKHTVLTSAFKYLSSGDIINLEKSMKYGDEFAGHFVQGHVDTTIKVLSVDSSNKKSWIIFFNIPKKFKKFFHFYRLRFEIQKYETYLKKQEILTLFNIQNITLNQVITSQAKTLTAIVKSINKDLHF